MRGVGKNSLVSICTKFISAAVSSPTITGGSLSGNNASIKVKRLFAGCPLYRSTSKLRNFCAAVRPEKVDMFSRMGGRPTGAKVRSPLAWAALAEDNKVDEAD